MDRTGWTASGNCRPRRVLRGPRPARARLQGSGVEGSGLRSRVLCSQRARRWGGSQGARGRPECCAASAAAVFIPGRWLRPFVAGRAACSWPGPPPPEPTWLCLWARLVFRGARGSRSSGGCTTTRRWKLEAALPGPGSRRRSAPGPPSARSPPPGRSSCRRRASRARLSGSRAPSSRGCGAGEVQEGGRRGVWVTPGRGWGGGITPSPPAPSCHIESRNHNSPWGTGWGGGWGGGTARRGRTQGWGRGTTASWPQPSSGAEGAPAPTPAPVRRGGDVAPTPPAPKLSLTGPLPARVRGWQRKDREARRHLRPAGWEWRAGTVPHPTLGTLRAQRPRPGRLAAHCAVASTFEAPGAELLFGGTSAPSSPSRGAATSGLLMSLRELPGQEFCFGSGERSDRGTQKAPSPDRRGLKEVRRSGPAPAQVPRPSQTSSLT